MLLGKLLLDRCTGFHDMGHVNLVEGGQGSVVVLGLLKATSNSLAHPVHGDAGFQTSTTDLRGSLFAVNRLQVGCARLSRGSNGSSNLYGGSLDRCSLDWFSSLKIIRVIILN